MFNFTVRGHDISDITSVEELGEKAQDYGVHTIQLSLEKSFPKFLSTSTSLNTGLGLQVNRILAKKDVTVGILSCYQNIIHPDKKIREEKLALFAEHIKNAKYFGAPIVATETGSILPNLGYDVGNFEESVFCDLLNVVKSLVKKGEEHGIIVGIEPGLNHPLYSLKRVQQLLEAIPSDYLQIILDPTNLITADNYQNQVKMVEKALDMFGSRICAFHIKDFVLESEKVIPTNFGEGIMEKQKILTLINKVKPGSLVVLEETKDEHIKVALQTYLPELGFEEEI